MQLNGLCCTLPAGRDQIEPSDHSLHRRASDKKGHPLRSCHGQILALIRKLASRFPGRRIVGCFRSDPPRKAYSGKFQDMAGVGLSYRVGGGNNPRIFSYAELYIGTNGFSEDEVLGSGGFGRVFKAVLPSDGTLVAVKCLAEEGEHFERTFAAELVAVANLRHRNLVRLRGWCVHEDQLLLVYDYMPNLSLDRVLFKRPENPNSAPLDWERRKRIARGLAAALFYLHEQLEAQIIHRDVKTSNVMLDSHYNARLGDFGLARWLEHDLEHHAETSSITGMRNHPFRVAETTRIGGTIGYLPPESLRKRYAATTKSDVFSFGVVVLEIATGRRAVDLSYPDDKIVLLDWVQRLADEGRLLQAGDARFPDGSYRLSEMELLLHLGLLCTLHDPKSRPDMRWALGTLSGNLLGKLPALPSFKTHPRYISLSSPNNTSTSTSATVTVTDSSATTVASTSTIYITAIGQTIFVTADPGDSNTGSGESARPQLKPLPIVETPREISYKEIVLATNNFSENHRIAEVDFGTAYHGFLKDRRHIMVKRLGIKTCPALRARFSTELQNLGRLRHRNLVQLRGWCTEQGEMLVIYDFLASRLLSHLLFHQGGRSCSTILQWPHRYNIIRSLASAILYLHEEWEEQVIHRHITSSSIVIDHDVNPRLTSFGLAEFLTRNEHGHHIVTDKSRSAQGIFGYISPEYLESGEANTAADIYSFGVVVLEVISGQMAVDFRHPEVLLVRKIHKFEVTKRPLLELADQQLDGKYDHQEFLRLAKLGMACTRSNPDLRPSIRQIVSILDGNEYSFKEVQKERTEEWRQRNAAALSLVRRIQALGIQ